MSQLESILLSYDAFLSTATFEDTWRRPSEIALSVAYTAKKQKRLLAIPDLQLQDALDTALAMQAAAQNSKALQQSDGAPSSVKKVSSAP